MSTKPPLPPFNAETAIKKVRLAENAWNTKDPVTVSLAYNSNLYAHNSFNGGCKEHCGQKVKLISNKNKLKNIDDQINIESKNSCLNKSLCRG